MSQFDAGVMVGRIFLLVFLLALVHSFVMKGRKEAERRKLAEREKEESAAERAVDPKGELVIVREGDVYRVGSMVFPTVGAASTYLRERVRQRGA